MPAMGMFGVAESREGAGGAVLKGDQGGSVERVSVCPKSGFEHPAPAAETDSDAG